MSIWHSRVQSNDRPRAGQPTAVNRSPAQGCAPRAERRDQLTATGQALDDGVGGASLATLPLATLNRVGLRVDDGEIPNLEARSGAVPGGLRSGWMMLETSHLSMGDARDVSLTLPSSAAVGGFLPIYQGFRADDGIRTRDPHLGKVLRLVHRVCSSPWMTPLSRAFVHVVRSVRPCLAPTV